eukprot:m.58070 g.58070  ORF g.58070 m.58070 type:complete len:198 (+) comp22491_c0_seq1:32-625(+)
MEQELLQWYAGVIAVCFQWASHMSTTTLDQVLTSLPVSPTQSAPPMDLIQLAVVVCSQTSIAEDHKLNDFRTAVNTLLATLPQSPLSTTSDDPWYSKDLFHVLCEVILLADVATIQTEVVAIITQAVISFGRDAQAIVGVCLVLRGGYGWGRGTIQHLQETQWLSTVALKSMIRAEEYLSSEHVGDLTLAQIINGLT